MTETKGLMLRYNMTKVLKIFLLITMCVTFIPKVQAQVTKNNLDQNVDQTQGNYAATNLNYLGSGSIGMMQSAWKDPLQHMGEGQSRPGYSKYYWTPELVLPVRLREGMYTLINFPNWEVIENVYLGDGTSFSANIEGPSSLMVYPDVSSYVGVDTNMIVFGRSGNKYVFYVQSETVNTDRITNSIIDIEVVDKKGKFVKNTTNGGAAYANGYAAGSGIYSQDSLLADARYTRNSQKEDWIENIPVDPTQFRFDIEVYVPNPDDIIIAPERVWRDNIFTYIDLGEKALTAVQRPIVTLIVERSETPVGFRAAGPHNRLIIVEGMGDMVLRSGKRIVCLKLRRADSDGLENTVYAKTNEWDEQNRYASQIGQNDNVATTDNYEDVYGNGRNNSSVNNSAFFNTNSFANSGSTPVNDERVLDSLPKTTPVISVPQVTGNTDVNVGKTELITPDYNNNNESVGVLYQSGKNGEKSAIEIANTEATKGNSSNNSNPVLIKPGANDKKQKMVVSAETEALLKEFRSANKQSTTENSNISIELGTDENVNNLEKMWNTISHQYSATLGKYQPFYSVDAPADGQGKDVFHLRVGPVNSLDEGDKVCSQLGQNGIFCSVVRVQ